MSKTKKILSVLSLAALLSLASCGETNTSGAKESTGTNTVTTAEKKITGLYTSPAKLKYQNMRPTYNYYLTSFTFETLELHDDSTAILSLSFSQFSAVILPEEGNAAEGNERTNYINKYYAPFTKTTDDLDDTITYITLGAISRLVIAGDSGYYVDTASWDSKMQEKAVDKSYEYDKETGTQKETGEKSYATGEEYLSAHKPTNTELRFTLNESAASMEFVELTFGDLTTSA